MDPRERLGDNEETLRIMMDARQADIHTGGPGIVAAWDASTMTATIQPAVMGLIRDKFGKWSPVALPLLQMVPVHFQSGGGFTATFPIAVGDECFFCIAERCIDGWWEASGIQPQAELRMHDLSDGFFFPKVWSKPKVLSPPPSTTTAQLRTDDGLCFVEITAAHKVNILTPGDCTITGNLLVTGEVTAKAGTANSVGLTTHKTAGIQIGGSVTVVGPEPGT